jgi:hypothetical protein
MLLSTRLEIKIESINQLDNGQLFISASYEDPKNINLDVWQTEHNKLVSKILHLRG